MYSDEARGETHKTLTQAAIMSSETVYRVGDGNGGVEDGWVTKEVDGKYSITLMTFDGYMDDGYFDTESEAIAYLKKSIKSAKKKAKEYSKRAEANGGMY